MLREVSERSSFPSSENKGDFSGHVVTEIRIGFMFVRV